MTKLYRVSALASGFVRMWRAWSIWLPIIVVNALVQGLLIMPAYSVDAPVINALLAVLSALIALKLLAFVTVALLRTPEGLVSWAEVFPELKRRTWRGMLWGAILLIVIAIGFALWTVPGILIAAVTPFTLIAALAGEGNPVAANFRTIGRRFWRWLVNILITGALITLGYLGSGFIVFFLRGMLGAGLVWLAAGFIAVWFTTAWVLIYRSAQQSA